MVLAAIQTCNVASRAWDEHHHDWVASHSFSALTDTTLQQLQESTFSNAKQRVNLKCILHIVVVVVVEHIPKCESSWIEYYITVVELLPSFSYPFPWCFVTLEGWNFPNNFVHWTSFHPHYYEQQQQHQKQILLFSSLHHSSGMITYFSYLSWWEEIISLACWSLNK